MSELIPLIVFVLIWYIAWTIIEKKHFKNILGREEENKQIVIITKSDSKKIDINGSELLSWNVVISIDYFKKFIASFINFFWWRMFVYESLIDRARREAILRVKEKAMKKWYNCLVNLRIETSSISKWRKWSIWSVEVLAYATWTKINS